MPERESLNIREAHERAELVHADSTLAPVSLTMAILAVLVAAISVMGHRAHNEILLTLVRANFQKAELVGQATQRHADSVLVEMVGVLNPPNTMQASALKEKFKLEMERYAADEKHVHAEQRRLETESQLARRKANRFNLGELFCEMALVLCSVTLLTRQRAFWFAGIAAGAVGVVLALSAFLVR